MVVMTVEENQVEEVVVDEVEEVEVVDDKELTPEQLKKELTKVRREAAAKRVKNVELEDKAKKYDEYVQSQKTEMERLSDEKEALAKEVAKLKGKDATAALRSKVAKKYKLDADLAGMLNGDEAEMDAQAKTLADRFKTNTSTDFYAGRRGTPVEVTADTAQEWFAAAWKESDRKLS